MLKIGGITDDPKQKHTILLPDGKKVVINLAFKPQQTGWFVKITYLDFVVYNLRVVTSPNMLHQFKNIIPFGLGCFVDGDQEPLFMNDFLSGRARLYILTQAETNQFEDVLNGQATT